MGGWSFMNESWLNIRPDIQLWCFILCTDTTLTDRQTDGKTERRTDRQTDRDRYIDKHPYRQTDGWTTDRNRDRQTRTVETVSSRETCRCLVAERRLTSHSVTVGSGSPASLNHQATYTPWPWPQDHDHDHDQTFSGVIWRLISSRYIRCIACPVH